jgi:tRNA nucleotidyltransferase/poly(A) polymerase
MGHKGYVAGGCFKNILKGEKVKDIDIFFETEADYMEADKYFREDGDYKLHYSSKKVRAYKNIETGMVLELIHSRFGKPIDLISDFDFSLTKFVYYREEIEVESDDSGGFFAWAKALRNVEKEIITKITHHKDFFEHLHMNRLVIDNKVKFPANTFERSLKYAKYGYKLCKESKAKLINAIRNNPFKDSDLNQSLYDGMD